MGVFPRQTRSEEEDKLPRIVDVASTDLVGSAGRGRRIPSVTPYLFLLIPVTLLAVLTYLPMLQMFALSLFEWDGFGGTKTFVGPNNYIEALTNPEIYGVFFVSLYYLVGSFVQIALALYLATIVSSGTRFRNFFKGVIFFPYLINGVAISFIFIYFFRPEGVLDSFSGFFGADPANNPLWLGDSHLVNISLTFVSVWRYIGLNFVLFLGAIQSIQPEILEAAEVDGANRWQQLRHIIIPGIRPIISLSLILAIAGSLSAFEIPFLMTPADNATATFVVKTVNMAFSNHVYGLAAAMAVILLVIILAVTAVQRLLVRDEPAELTQ
jgi:ABC-type sugar transport system permease subunit